MNVHTLRGIWTRSPKNRTAADLHLRPHGQRDQQGHPTAWRVPLAARWVISFDNLSLCFQLLFLLQLLFDVIQVWKPSALAKVLKSCLTICNIRCIINLMKQYVVKSAVLIPAYCWLIFMQFWQQGGRTLAYLERRTISNFRIFLQDVI